MRRKAQGQPRSIRVIILISYTLASLMIMSILGLSFYSLFTTRTKKMLIESTGNVSRQEVVNIEAYLSSMRGIANALYYDVIKGTDISSTDLSDRISLLYAANSDEIVSIALFKDDGTLITAAPNTPLKPGADPKEQSWFTDALAEVENVHFSQPHIQNLFVSKTYDYNWVISLSMAVDLNENGTSSRGVLLIDMNYQDLEQLLESTNQDLSSRYSYLASSDGSMIYHPYQSQIQAEHYQEATSKVLREQDGAHQETYGGKKMIVVVDTVSYTGWKLVSVIPSSALAIDARSTRSLIIMIICLTIMVMILINRALANRVSQPLIRLNDAIANMEGVRNIPDNVYANGSKEVQELGSTLHNYMNQINRLMDDMVKEEEDKRRSELDALQAQINPHFLYNTLDSIVWMIEGGKDQEAVYMITQLASFFRMSLNRGKAMISIGNEIKQAQAYLAIQKIRYKQSFKDYYEIEDGIENDMIVKLVIQPILENAIYHGIKEAEQDGEIRIHGWKDGSDIYISISDNGYGMTPEEVNSILDEKKRPAVEKHGSGVGLINVDKRLRLRFGEGYGLKVESELDEGTTVTIHIPAIEATQENLERYENGKEGDGHEPPQAE
ncbi:MAG: sensor histidine kinase [Lactimicrobium sp.]|jgi:two-component system sensor histidine kinase YesM|uniref:sensor histidine kinase n=1 Tax=Lactimicrobium sp. TaxID=2563780 RepID=UPI002F35D7C6